MQQENPKFPGRSSAREMIESIAIAAVLTTFIILFVARSFVVEGSSMVPTLENGQRLLVEEMSTRMGGPHRGDVIVFNQDPDRRFIKRVIGLPGDVVEIRDGKVRVNGTELKESFLKEPAFQDYGPVVVPDRQYVVFGDNRNSSDDSRGSVGFLSHDRIIGRAVFRFWPITKIAVLIRPKTYQTLTESAAGSIY